MISNEGMLSKGCQRILSYLPGNTGAPFMTGRGYCKYFPSLTRESEIKCLSHQAHRGHREISSNYN